MTARTPKPGSFFFDKAEIENIVRKTIAETWEQMAKEPEYQHCAEALRMRARLARAALKAGEPSR